MFTSWLNKDYKTTLIFKSNNAFVENATCVLFGRCFCANRNILLSGRVGKWQSSWLLKVSVCVFAPLRMKSSLAERS